MRKRQDNMGHREETILVAKKVCVRVFTKIRDSLKTCFLIMLGPTM